MFGVGVVCIVCCWAGVDRAMRAERRCQCSAGCGLIGGQRQDRGCAANVPAQMRSAPKMWTHAMRRRPTHAHQRFVWRTAHCSAAQRAARSVAAGAARAHTRPPLSSAPPRPPPIHHPVPLILLLSPLLSPPPKIRASTARCLGEANTLLLATEVTRCCCCFTATRAVVERASIIVAVAELGKLCVEAGVGLNGVVWGESGWLLLSTRLLCTHPFVTQRCFWIVKAAVDRGLVNWHRT